MTAAPDQQSRRLGLLLQLEHRARRAESDELPFVMVNETADVLHYQQAALWRFADDTATRGRLAALSGVAVAEAQAPYARWLERVLPIVAARPPLDALRIVGPTDLPDDLARDWAEWLPAHAVWCPMARAGGTPLGGLLVARSDEPWTEPELQVLELLAEHYAQCWILAETPKAHVPWARTLKRRRKVLAGAALFLVAAAVIPVRESALVPAEVVPTDPVEVRAPFDGVVDAIDVRPNAAVTAGEVLARLDTDKLRTRLQVAVKARDIAEAEYDQAAQEAMAGGGKARLAVLQAKIAQEAAEVAYVTGRLSRADLRAPVGGIAIFDSPTDWTGRPVSLGERIMLVADPRRVELEMQVPAADAVTFADGAPVTFFRNVAPDRPVSARVTFASYGSSVTAEGGVAYRFRARFSGGGALRIGLKGTAKLFGARRPLIVWLLRRPLVALRQWLTL
jgi:hypothetical protein